MICNTIEILDKTSKGLSRAMASKISQPSHGEIKQKSDDDDRTDNNDDIDNDNTNDPNDNNEQDMGLPADLERVDGAMRWGHNDKTYFFSGGIFLMNDGRWLR